MSAEGLIEAVGSLMRETKAERIAFLRKRVASNKGVVDRGEASARELLKKITLARQQMFTDQAEIKALGGKVRR